jgi:potassium efflux system protein
VARQNREAAESSGAASPETLDVPEITLESINEQTRTLLLLASGLFVVVSLWIVWKELLPALGVLEEIPLWHHSVNLTGAVELEQISLGDSIQALLVVLVTYLAGRNLPGLIEILLLQRMNLASGTRYAIAALIRYTIVAIGIVVAFSLIGVGWSDVQWLVAAIGVGLGFGVREIIGSYIAGLIILFERPLRVGDFVTLGEVTGTVSRIRIRATTLVDADNKEQLFPNIIIVTRQLTNWTLSDKVARAIIKVAIAHGSDTALASKVMLEVVEVNPRVLEDPRPRVFFLGFGENALEFEVRFFMKEHLNRASLLHDLHMALERSLCEHGIQFPNPRLDINIAKKEVEAGKTE